MKPNQIYLTLDGRRLKLKTIRTSGLHSLITVNDKGEPVASRLNKDGKLIESPLKDYTTETILTFKKVKL